MTEKPKTFCQYCRYYDKCVDKTWNDLAMLELARNGYFPVCFKPNDKVKVEFS